MDGWLSLRSEENMMKDRTNPGLIANQTLVVLLATSNITELSTCVLCTQTNQMLFRIKTESRFVRVMCCDGCRQG
jgi:hypothetical protein